MRDADLIRSTLERLKGGERLRVTVRPNSSSDSLEWDSTRNLLRVRLKARAVDNKANVALCKLLGKSIGKPVRILRGASSRDKTVEVL